MYEAFFGLREAPFALTPDTRYFLGAQTHQQALELLLVALAQQEGFVRVSGEVGTGKTLLCRLLLSALEGRVMTAWLPNPGMGPEGLYAALADELGADVGDVPAHRLLRIIHQRLLALAAEGRSVVLIVDEAHTLGVAGLEAVRLLSNLETERRKLLQIVLLGQPELEVLLARDDLRQLQQRITFSCRLQPLDRQAVADYVEHRLRQAGYAGVRLFDARALRALAQASGGIPRLINVLAHKALWAAYGDGVPAVSIRHVRRAVRDTDSVRPLRWWRAWA
ncbi:MAG: AAA family ATPase [Gammaproteobacteria bacterium]|nr:AAA family ATPase [Gammaproteobacteria bacterium]